MTTQEAFTIILEIVDTILSKMYDIGEWRRRFISEVSILFIGIKGRKNFLQMERIGQYSEKTYRNNFNERFDFLKMNSTLIDEVCSDQKIIVFDPTYLSKSGKHTPEVGMFYSGSAGMSKRGIEIGVLCVVDVKQNTAYSLESVQTPASIKGASQDQTQTDHYIQVIKERVAVIKSHSSILVVDGWFSKKKFVDAMIAMDLEMVSKMRIDANLSYKYNGPKNVGRGRPRLYEGKIDLSNIDRRRLKYQYTQDNMEVLSGVVYSHGLKRYVKIVILEFYGVNEKKVRQMILFSTNLESKAQDIVTNYRSRFQIEFLIRDSKQYTGLQTCEARSADKLHFHHNMSLFATSLARATIRKQHGNHVEIILSVGDIQTEINNELLVNLFISMSEIDPELIKNKLNY